MVSLSWIIFMEGASSSTGFDRAITHSGPSALSALVKRPLSPSVLWSNDPSPICAVVKRPLSFSVPWSNDPSPSLCRGQTTSLCRGQTTSLYHDHTTSVP